MFHNDMHPIFAITIIPKSYLCRLDLLVGWLEKYIPQIVVDGDLPW